MDLTGLPTPTLGGNQDAQAFVEFFAKAVLHGYKSELAGHPIYEQADFIKVMFPGERDAVVRKATDLDKRRWPRHWEAYQAQRDQTDVDGTALIHLFPGNPEIVETLKGLRFVTVEQLANASDTALQSIGMGGREWQTKAQRFLENAKKAGDFHKVEKALAERDAMIEQLREQVAALAAQVGDDKPRRSRAA